MRKKFLLLLLCFAMLLGTMSGVTLGSTAAASGKETVEYLEASDLLYDLMETATTFVVAEHKALGGSHYAYTEGLYEESTGEAASGVGTEMNFAASSRLVLVTLAQEGNRIKKTETVILDSKAGCVRDPDVSPDGTKLLFSWKQRNTDDFHLYEMDLTDGKYSYKQLTFGSGVADFEGQYLANGDILFSSSRAVQTVDCWKTPVSNIYKMSADGSNIVRLGYDQVHTTYPTTTSDGRVIYTRWDYNDRTQMYVQGLFQMNSDGTNQTELYGNNSSFPTTLIHARQIPDTYSKYIAIATGHHTYQAGKLVVVDVSVGRDGNNSVTFPFPDSTTTKPNDYDAYGQNGSLYQYPYALNEDQYLVSYCPTGWASNRQSTPFGIYLMDRTTKEKIELVKGNATTPAAQIVPVKTRNIFYRPSTVDYSMNTGIYYIHDVYQGEAVKGVAKGSVANIRVVALDYRPYAVGATVASAPDGGSSDPYTPIATGNGSWDVKAVLGLATVYEDGSAMFKVPSETPVYFQLLDKDGHMIQTMRSWSTLMPGELYSCVGCHEDNNTAPPAASTVSMASKAGVEELKPDAWQKDKENYNPYTTKEGFSYLEEVQTIWDAKCISCHDNKNAAYSEINVNGMRESGVTATTVKGTLHNIFSLQSDWQYMTSASNNAPAGWNNLGFTGSWSTGKAGFGDRGGDGAKVGTNWSGGNNWLFARKTFTIDDLSKFQTAIIRVNTWYDDTPVFYLNGHQIYTDGENWKDSYVSIDLNTAAQYLVQGENVFAVSIHQHTGGRFFDLALSLLIPDATDTDPSASHPFSLEGVNIGAERMARYFPLSYLVLTGSRPNASVQWVGNSSNSYIVWLSSMSGAILRQPNTYGSSKSNLVKILREGHAGVKMTDDELRTIAAWIDLCVPCYGDYAANNYWDANEKREAEEEQNKRDFYTMMNDYARMSLSGRLPQGTVKITYTTGGKTHAAEGQGLVQLYLAQKIKANDKVTVTLPEGVKYVGFTLSPKQGESIIYCPDGTFEYVVPKLASLATTISKSYANTSNYITARILTEEELSAKRNLAENTYDYTNNSSIKSNVTNQFPHATSDSEWENNKGSGETDFLARNAIDGFTNNRGHGGYPVQSWGPANTGKHYLTVDFGRGVKVEELGIVIRYDAGHDTYFKSANVELTFEDGTTATQAITIEWLPGEQIFRLKADKPVTKITIKDLVSQKSGGWAALTEVAVYGCENLK